MSLLLEADEVTLMWNRIQSFVLLLQTIWRQRTSKQLKVGWNSLLGDFGEKRHLEILNIMVRSATGLLQG